MKKETYFEGRKPVFIDIKSDFGFKRCMSDEIVMKSFLNAILSEDYGRIEKVEFKNVEVAKERMEHHGVRFDLRCTIDDGTEVVIEMQNYGHRFFKTRASYYLCRLMVDLVPSDIVWSTMEKDIPKMVGIFILGVPMMGLSAPVTVTSECDMSSKEEVWDGMRKYYISLPKFKWEEEETPSSKSIWMEVIKNLGTMSKFNQKMYDMADEGLRRLIDKARVSRLSGKELAEYEAGLKNLSDYGTAEAYGYDNGFRRGMDEGLEKGMKEGMEKGLEKGLEEGMEKGMEKGLKEHSIQVARLMLAHSKPMEEIILFSGLTEEEIKALMK